MFSGIVEKIGLIGEIRDTPHQRIVSIGTPAGWKFTEGESVAVEGVCSTVQQRAARSFQVVYMHETLRRTTLASLRRGSRVNLERSLRLNGLVSGHLVQGHVDTTGKIQRIRKEGEARIYQFDLPASYLRYIVEKGSIAIDGISLTVTATTARGCSVSVLAYTLAHTTLGGKKAGERVNIEVDLVAKYVEKLSSR
ncbi:MAG: riboflavin synthase [Opitutaceae bacterium]